MGLLDDFLNSDQTRLGLGLLAAAGPRADGAGFGQRLMEGIQSGQAMGDAAQKREMQKLQFQQAYRKNQMMNDWLQQLQGGASSEGGSPAVSGGASDGGTSAGSSPVSSIGNVPRNAMFADMALNDGKNISEWMYKQGTPDMQVSNGYAYNKNTLQPGFMPSVNTSQDGKSTLTLVGKDGMPQTMPTPGSVDAYRAFTGAGEATKAGYDVVEVPMGDGTTQRMPRSEAIKLLQSAPTAPQTSQSGYAGGSAQAAAPEQTRIMKSELLNPNLTPQDKAAIQREIARLEGSKVGLQISDAEKAKQKILAEGEATRTNDNIVKGNQFDDFGNQIKVARNLLQLGPTGSGVGAMVDQVGGFFGVSPTSANLAKQLETVSGWMIQNIPKAPGAQSDAELRDYKVSAGIVGDRTVPVAQRLAALDKVEELKNMWQTRVQGKTEQPAQTNTAPMASLPPAQQHKGRMIRDTETGKTLRSDGLAWKEVK